MHLNLSETTQTSTEQPVHCAVEKEFSQHFKQHLQSLMPKSLNWQIQQNMRKEKNKQNNTCLVSSSQSVVV